MDALTGYGSDSSSSSYGKKNDSNVKAPDDVNPKPITSANHKQSALSSLVGAGIDSSSDDDENSRERNDDSAMSNSHQSESKNVARPLNDHMINAKRQRLGNEDWRSMLPTPPMSSVPLGEPSMILWNVDYLNLPLSQSDTERDEVIGDYSNVAKKHAKFEQLVSTLPYDKSWAKHLQEQQEFSNPHFFQSVVEYFGIAQPLGSQLGSD